MKLRMLRPRLLAVGHGALWVCDERLPVVARVHRATGEVLGVASWPVDEALRERPSIADIDAGGDAVWVAAPNAGGLVRLSPDLKEQPVLVPTGGAVGSIAAHGSTCWAREESHGGEPDGSLGPTIWRVGPDEMTPVDLGGFVWRIEATPNGPLALMQRPARTHVEQPHPGGSRSWFYPGVLVRARRGAVEEVVELEDLGGASLHVVGERAWVRSGGHTAPQWLAEVDVAGARLGDPMPLPSPVMGIAVDGRRAWVHTNDLRHLASWDRQEAFVRVLLGNGRDLQPQRAVVRGDVFDFVADDDYLWATRDVDARGEGTPIRVDADTLEVVEWPVAVDLTGLLPPARPTQAVDPVAHAEEERSLLERSRVEGLTFDRVYIDGTFPDAELIVLFRARHRRGVTFGRRWPLFDDFGVPQTLDYATIEMEEDVVAAGHGLPPVDKCVRDEDGVVWF